MSSAGYVTSTGVNKFYCTPGTSRNSSFGGSVEAIINIRYTRGLTTMEGAWCLEGELTCVEVSTLHFYHFFFISNESRLPFQEQNQALGK